MIYSISEGGWVEGETFYSDNHYLEIVHPTLFTKGKARLFRHAHPDSLSRDHLLQSMEFEKIEETAGIMEYFNSIKKDDDE